MSPAFVVQGGETTKWETLTWTTTPTSATPTTTPTGSRAAKTSAPTTGKSGPTRKTTRSPTAAGGPRPLSSLPKRRPGNFVYRGKKSLPEQSGNELRQEAREFFDKRRAALNGCRNLDPLPGRR